MVVQAVRVWERKRYAEVKEYLHNAMKAFQRDGDESSKEVVEALQRRCHGASVFVQALRTGTDTRREARKKLGLVNEAYDAYTAYLESNRHGEAQLLLAKGRSTFIVETQKDPSPTMMLRDARRAVKDEEL